MSDCIVVTVGCVLLALVVGGSIWDGGCHEKRIAAALGHLLLNGESYGLDIVKNSSGLLARGTIYILLRELEDEGLVKSREEELTPDYIGIPRRLYQLTALGRAEALTKLAAKESRGAA